jgi:hypothetical protein
MSSTKPSDEHLPGAGRDHVSSGRQDRACRAARSSSVDHSAFHLPGLRRRDTRRDDEPVHQYAAVALDMRPEPITRLFAVLGLGGPVAGWLARAINCHSEIFCVSAWNGPLLEFVPSVRLDGLGHATLIFRAARFYQAAGDVGGFLPSDLEVVRYKFGESFRAAVVTSEPLEQLRRDAVTLGEPNGAVSGIGSIETVLDERLLSPDLKPEERRFIQAAEGLNSIVGSETIGPVYRVEDVAARADVFAELVDYLSGGRVSLDEQSVRKALEVPPPTASRSQPFSDWQRGIIAKVVRSETWDCYEDLGYERPAFTSSQRPPDPLPSEASSGRGTSLEDAVHVDTPSVVPSAVGATTTEGLSTASEVQPTWRGNFRQLVTRDGVHLFSIVSWGAAATAWVAKALNAHPEIFCVHASAIVFLRFQPAIRLDGVHYGAFLVRGAGAHKVVGDVHGVPGSEISALGEAFGPHFSAAVLVREPLPRLISEIAHFATFAKTGLSMDVSYIERVIEKAGLVLPASDPKWSRLFVHGVNMLNAIIDEREVGPIYRVEDLTGDPGTLGELIRHISGGRIDPDPAWVAKTLELERVNVHRQPKDSELSAWQIEVIQKVVKPEAWECYEQLGYRRPEFLAV